MSFRSGSELHIVDADDVVAGVTIEYSQATDMEEGPEEPDPASVCVPISSLKDEHYLHVLPAGATEADIALQLRAAQDSVQAASSTTRKSVGGTGLHSCGRDIHTIADCSLCRASQ